MNNQSRKMNRVSKRGQTPPLGANEEIFAAVPYWASAKHQVRWLNARLDGPHVDEKEVRTVWTIFAKGDFIGHRRRAYEYRGRCYWEVADIYRGRPADIRLGWLAYDTSRFSLRYENTASADARAARIENLDL